jgi:anaphase-promoting complex subunit 3
MARAARSRVSHPVVHIRHNPTPILAGINYRQASSFPESAVLLCRAGTAAMKGHQPERAVGHFKEALKLNPLIWEAFEGLCALGRSSIRVQYRAHLS